VEGKDYTVTMSWTITPAYGGIATDLSDGGTFTGPNYEAGVFSLTFDRWEKERTYLGRPYPRPVTFSGRSSPASLPRSTYRATILYEQEHGHDMITSMVRMGQSLLQNSSREFESITDVDNVQQALLSSRAEGARVNAFETTQTRNESR